MSESAVAYLGRAGEPVDADRSALCDDRCRRVRFVDPDTCRPRVGWMHARAAHELTGSAYVIAHAGVTVDYTRGEIRVSGRPAPVSRGLSTRLVAILCAARGGIVSHRELYLRLWGEERCVHELCHLVTRTRRAIAPARIVNVLNEGWRLDGPAR